MVQNISNIVKSANADRLVINAKNSISKIFPLAIFRKHELMKAFVKSNFELENPVFVSMKSDFLYKLERLTTQNRPIMVAITGESASGKSFFTQNLKKFISDSGIDCSFISCDNFYKDISCYYEKYGNYGNALAAGVDLEGPFAFDLDELSKTLDEIASGKDVCIPKMNLSNGVCIKNQTPVKSAKIVLVEGIASMWNDLDRKFDVTIYVELDEATRKARHLERAASRTKSHDEALPMWKYMSASAELHIKPHRNKVDVVMNGNYNIDDLLHSFAKLKSIIEQNL